MSNPYLYGQTEDNKQSKSLDEIFKIQFPKELLNELYDISGKKISDLKNQDGFLIYCNEDKLKDDVENNSILQALLERKIHCFLSAQGLHKIMAMIIFCIICCKKCLI